MIIDGLGPCDFTSPATHAAVKLDRAAPAALSFDELAEGYSHAIDADLTRVKHYAHLGPHDNQGAITWLMHQVVDELEFRGGKHKTKTKRQLLRHVGGAVSLAPGCTLDTLRFDGEKIEEVIDIHAQLREPFDPMTGSFTDDIRIKATTVSDDTELRESMKEFGWIEQLPAIKDERGVVLVGHRRIRIAEELNLPTRFVTTLWCGDGDEADAYRFKLALASNIGSKPLSKADRERIAAYLYNERGWSMQKIGEALNVSKRQISSDLKAESVSGREAASQPRRTHTKPARSQAVQAKVDKAVELLSDPGMSYRKAGPEVGLDESVLRRDPVTRAAHETAHPKKANVKTMPPPSTMKAARTLITRIDKLITQLADTLSGPLSDDDAELLGEEVADARAALEALEGKLKVR